MTRSAILARSVRWLASGRAPRGPTCIPWVPAPTSRVPWSTATSTRPSWSGTSFTPIDRQTNGPQLFYGLRYHTHIVKPGEAETFHDQVGYWLWEPAARTVLHMLAIPRGQVLLAAGEAEPDAKEFEVSATLGSEVKGIVSNPFLDLAFHTVSFRMRVTVNDDGTWSYEEHTVMRIPDREGLVDHVDRNTLRRIGEPKLNPLATESA